MAILNIEFNSKILVKDISVSMIYPMGSTEKPKVFYFLHGYGDNNTTTIRKSLIESYVHNKNIAVVFPNCDHSFYTNMKFGINYYDYFLKELVPSIENTFNVSKKYEDTFIGGLSMGGYGSLKIALSNPEKFSKCAPLSPAIDIEEIRNVYTDQNTIKEFIGVFGDDEKISNENDLNYLVKNYKTKKEPLKIYRSCGTEDFLYNDNLKFTKVLDENKMNHKFIEKTGQHDWNYWNQELKDVIDFLLE